MPKAFQIVVWVKFSSANVTIESVLLWMLMLTLLKTDVWFFEWSHIIDSNQFHKCRKGRCHDLSYDTVTCLSESLNSFSKTLKSSLLLFKRF